MPNDPADPRRDPVAAEVPAAEAAPFALASAVPPPALGGVELAGLIEREFQPAGELQRAAVEQAVRALAEQALMHTVTVSDDAYSTIEAVLAAVDSKLPALLERREHHACSIDSPWPHLP